MYDCMLTDVERAVSREARDFIKSEVSTELIKAMDKDEITYPREYVKKLGDRNLLGLRVPKKWGGRGLPWTAEVAVEEEIGVLGAALGCAYVMPSIVGEALNTFGTEMSWDVVNKAMQIMGGIGYTNVYPIEKALRDTRLCMIWTGTNEIMNLLIQHEYYREVLGQAAQFRDFEADATGGDGSEKCFTDEDMWRFHEETAAVAQTDG